jgi:dCTP deaminase
MLIGQQNCWFSVLWIEFSETVPSQDLHNADVTVLIGRWSMILSGSEIQARLGTDIRIDPFSEDQLNPNSYNLRLHSELLVYEEIVLDMRRPSRYRRIQIPPEGLVLQPNQMYLGRTMEYTETRNLVPMLEGRSSIGRLGMFVHVTAGFGDVGFCGYWTLEIIAVQPIRVYAGVQVCQIFYHTVEGAITEYHSGKYQKNEDIQPSFLYKDFQREDRQKKLDFGGDGQA